MSAPAAPALRRDPAHGVITGVAAGLAGRLGIDPIIVRVGFIATSAAGGAGLVLYLLAWAVMPAAGGARAPIERLAGPRETWLAVAGIAMLTLAALLLLREWGIWLSDVVAWPLVLAAAGGALIWRQSTAQPEGPERLGLAAAPDVAGRALFGAALVVAAGLVFLWLAEALQPARDVLLAVVVVVIALTLILAPWWLRLVRGLSAERAERIRSQERAEVAAHLHDSVLQTLALMQRRVDDPREIAALARRQERELRAWLNDRRTAAADTVAGALEAAATEVEEAHGVPIDVVAVGDAALDERSRALVAAAREALVNAAKFAGDGPVSLYAEVEPDRIQAFVRDRGPGFEPASVPADRRGVRDSIVGRMARHRGRAVLHTAPGEGTEVELVLER